MNLGSVVSIVAKGNGTMCCSEGYVCVFILAFLLQMGSLAAQRSISEENESTRVHPVPVAELIAKTILIVRKNSAFRMFLYSAAFLTLSFTSFAFFTVSAMQKYSLNESFVGVFTVITVFGQIVSGAILGWLSDGRGAE